MSQLLSIYGPVRSNDDEGRKEGRVLSYAPFRALFMQRADLCNQESFALTSYISFLPASALVFTT